MTQLGLTNIVSRPHVTKSVTFHLSCIPPKTSHHAKRIVRIGKFSRLADKPELVAAKNMLDALLLPHQPTQPIVGAVSLDVVYVWPWRASDGRRTRDRGLVPMTSRPDVDNLAKSLTDRLVALRFIEDDSNVVELHVRKWWGGSPGITVTISAIAPADQAKAVFRPPVFASTAREGVTVNG